MKVWQLWDTWLDEPENAIITLRRRHLTGERRQWAVAESGQDVVVYEARGDGAWVALPGAHHDWADALEVFPELRTLRKGTISEYEIQWSVPPGEFARLLDLSPADGDENPEDWPSDVSDEWDWLQATLDKFPPAPLVR